MPDYIALADKDLLSLNSKVDAAIADGLQPIGGIIHDSGIYIQACYRSASFTPSGSDEYYVEGSKFTYVLAEKVQALAGTGLSPIGGIQNVGGVYLQMIGPADAGGGGDAQEIMLRNHDGWIEWKHADDVAWIQLVSMASLTGSTGAQGPAGPQGIPGPVGASGLNWKGLWSASTAYVLNDAVSYSGASYFCINPNTNAAPIELPGDPNWALMASEGATGPQGPEGIQGATGAMGPAGDTGATGATGAKGDKGDKGDAGTAGIEGPQGDDGPQGIQGIQGVKGDKGDKGDTGNTGATGAAGPANSLSIGTVNSGATAGATITGTAPAQTLNLTLPAYNPQSPASKAITIGTAAQHSDLTKPFRVSVNVRASQNVTVAGTIADKLELRIGPTSASVAAAGSGGFSVGVWESGITGIALMIGAAVQDGGEMVADLPAGWYFSVNRLSGTNASVVSCFTQSMM